MKEGEYSRIYEYKMSEDLYYGSICLMLSIKNQCLKFIFFVLVHSSLNKNDNYYKKISTIAE